MKRDALRIALATVAGRPNGLSGNVHQMLDALRQAEQQGAQAVVFPRESLMGATAGTLQFPSLLPALEEAVRTLAAAAVRCACLFSFQWWAEGRTTLAVALAEAGVLRALAFPQVGGEAIYPYLDRVKEVFGDQVALSGTTNLPLRGANTVIGVMLGWDEREGRRLLALGAEHLAVMDASPTLADRDPARDLRLLSGKLGCGCALVNAGGNESTMDAVYGGELAAAHSGRLLHQLEAFHGQALMVADLPYGSDPESVPALPAAEPRMPFAPPAGEHRTAWCRKALEIPAQGLAQRLMRTGSRTALLGLSGGLDSALALLTARRALEIAGLPAEALLAYSLPAFGTSDRTRRNVRLLVDALGLPHREIDLSASVQVHLDAIDHGGALDAAYENAQARERTQVLMDLCNMHRGLMVGPGDMSELALGFTTYGGDHMSMYGTNAGLPKSAIRLILRQAAEDAAGTALQEALEAVLDTPISPELLPGGQASQQTERILGSYEVNDCILWHLLEGEDMQGILRRLAAAFPELDPDARKEALRHFMRRFISQQFKRSCAPDGPQVLKHTLAPRGPQRIPSDADAAAWLQAIEEAQP